MEYEKHHIMDISIEDETQRNGRDISVFVDTHEMVNIEVGNTVTIRTDEAGIDDLRNALEKALSRLDQIRYEKTNAAMSISEDEMIQAGIDAREEQRELSAQQTHDPYDYTHTYAYNPNDPRNW